jgi:hypothetical protein
MAGYEAFGIQAGNAIQTAFSDVLMGMREGRAQQELSLRQRAFEQEQEMRSLAIQNTKRTMDLERATALGSTGAQSQFEKLQTAAINEDYEGLKSATYQDVQIEGVDPESIGRFNNAQREAFRIQKANYLSASAGQKNRLQDINNLTEYSLTLGADPIQRGYADEARALLQAGIPISQLGAEHAKALTDSAQYAAKKSLSSNPTYMAKQMDMTVEMAKLSQTNRDKKLTQEFKALDDQVDAAKTQWIEYQKVAAQAAQSGNQKLYENAQANAEKFKMQYLESVAKRNQAQRGAFSNEDALRMMESSTLPKDGEITYTVNYTLPGETQVRTRQMTQAQYSDAISYNGSLLNIKDFSINTGKPR